ncbi:hypothetical protein BABINDRAFT_179808 [Babjeviella inositovora NRRL Y-12698]|uniref:Cell wall mannoprotein PIR1-like C-terminal domain-containing protein n=1 Tax=Babjeviella inositovora NRRL Y-12698 TaxID=984486 RepID=A0A1E3QUS4_9ASCO|nr:uncharacterized protein BABINDRAFT_179808 [Babjeviella inositovora NRRL Y-12698]ODQ81314.1 hypothetical protein BABINDRAFT_179808 [Babjeviella inositovora NRRL Y-12698]
MVDALSFYKLQLKLHSSPLIRKSSLITNALPIRSAIAAYVPAEPWSTLTPSAKAPSGAVTDYPQTFGIIVQPIATVSSAAAAPVAAKGVNKDQAVSQIGDGQVQATTKTAAPVVTQIGDGQIQATTKAVAPVVTQIGDGQIQATTKAAAPVVTQIGDGQIQATTKAAAPVVTQIGDGQIQATTNTAAPVVSQIGDGQIQATTKTAPVVTQIGDGQIQATTKTVAGVSQIGDGQIQATTAKTVVTTGVAQISDGQAQNTAPAVSGPVQLETCLTDSSLAITLKGGIINDKHGRVGAIVANRQFQFDGPPPQAGSIYAAGWSITTDGLLALGDSTTFYQCLSGSFYNLYDESIGTQCIPINLEVVNLISC